MVNFHGIIRHHMSYDYIKNILIIYRIVSSDSCLGIRLLLLFKISKSSLKNIRITGSTSVDNRKYPITAHPPHTPRWP